MKIGNIEDLVTNTQSSRNERIMDFIIKIVGEYFCTDSKYYFTKSRKFTFVYPRQIAMYFAKIYTRKASLETIGDKFSRDHSSVSHSINKIKSLLDVDRRVQQDVKTLMKKLKTNVNAISEDITLGKEYYYLDLNDFNSITLKEDKSIILTGFSDKELSEFLSSLNDFIETKKHNNTGMYVLEKKH
jgi:hypothetical protein